MAGAENGDGDRSLTAQVIAEIERQSSRSEQEPPKGADDSLSQLIEEKRREDGKEEDFSPPTAIMPQ